jgi:hypothetical protein
MSEIDLITRAEAAKILGVCSITIDRMRKAKLWHEYQVGDGVRPRIKLDRAEIVAYRDNHRTMTADEIAAARRRSA